MTKNIEKFILSKPWNVGRFNKTFPAGTIISVDQTKDLFETDGHEYTGLAELKIAVSIKDKKTGIPLIMPYSEKSSVVKDILSSVQSRIKEKEVAAKKYKVIKSDNDLVDEIDVSDIKIKPKEKIPGKEKVAKLDVIQESNVSFPTKKSSPEEIEKRIANLQKPMKMQVVEEDDSFDGEKIVQLSPKVKVKPLASVKVTKK